MHTIRQIITFGSRFINYKMGAAGALIMGAIVVWINIDHGWGPATTAGLKQAAYTFFLGGTIIKLLETITLRINHKILAITLAVIITSLVTIGLVYFVHSMRGTPKPFESTLPTIILAPPGFLALSIRKRRKTKLAVDSRQ
jgi:hypothetical protein